MIPYGGGRPEHMSGAIRSMLLLAEALLPHGPTAVVLLEDGYAASLCRQLGIQTYTVSKTDTLMPGRVKRVLHTIKTIKHAVEDFNADVINAHAAPANRYCWPAAKLTGKPLVTHQREFYKQNYFHAGLGLADHIVPVSAFVQSTLPPRLRKKSTVVFDATAVPPTQQLLEAPAIRDPSKPVIIGMGGRCVPYKGQDLLVEAAQILANDSQVPDFGITIWGMIDSGAQDRVDFANRVRSAVQALPERVRKNSDLQPFRGDVENLYKSIDILAVPSRVAEGFGRMAIEAMAWERPVVASAHGGLAEVVNDGHDGFKHKPDDPKDLAEKLKQLIIDPQLRKTIGQRARNAVIQRFSAEAHAQAMIDVYRAVTV